MSRQGSENSINVSSNRRRSSSGPAVATAAPSPKRGSIAPLPASSSSPRHSVLSGRHGSVLTVHPPLYEAQSQQQQQQQQLDASSHSGNSSNSSSSPHHSTVVGRQGSVVSVKLPLEAPLQLEQQQQQQQRVRGSVLVASSPASSRSNSSRSSNSSVSVGRHNSTFDAQLLPEELPLQQQQQQQSVHRSSVVSGTSSTSASRHGSVATVNGGLACAASSRASVHVSRHNSVAVAAGPIAEPVTAVRQEQ
jgi:hypothetical protein